MKRLPFVAVLLLSLFALKVRGQEVQKPERSDFVSDASFVVGTYAPASREHSPKAMVTAANEFLAALTDEQREKASHELKSGERLEWTNLPARPNAGGVRLGDLKPDQVKKACDLLGCLFSEQGYNKMRDIMIADDQLLKNGRPRNGFGTENFSLVVFGTPSESEAWAFQIDGHHVGVNLAFEGKNITMSPSFIGTQPHTFKIGGTEFKPLNQETELAHKLVNSLSDEQSKKAVVGTKRAMIITGPGNDGNVPTAKGVSCSTFSDDQKKILSELISQWVNDLPPTQAEKRFAEITSEFDEMKFSWNGNKAPQSDISYTIQSPTLIIEYACQDLGGNPIDHLHSVYRNPANEYGKQLK